MAALSPAAGFPGGQSRLGSGFADRSSSFLLPRIFAVGCALAVLLALGVGVLIGRPMELAGLSLQAAARTWRPGQAFDLVAARQLVEGSEMAAGSYGLASRFRAATAVCGLAALLLFALR